MSGLFTAIGGTLENGMSTYVTNVSTALSSALIPIVTTAVTIWVIAYGLATVRGEAHESVPAFAWRGLKVAAILSFALGSGIYQQQVVTAVNGATSGLAQTIQMRQTPRAAAIPDAGRSTAAASRRPALPVFTRRSTVMTSRSISYWMPTPRRRRTKA